MRAKHARQIREGIHKAKEWVDMPFSEQIYGPALEHHDHWLKCATELEWVAYIRTYETLLLGRVGA